jgi:hypothetical protein
MGLLEVDGKKLTITGKLLRTVRIEEEWYEDIEDPGYLLKRLRDSKVRADIFTFWQRLPETKPKFDYHMEWDNVAALPIKGYDHWWKKQLNDKTRNLVRKAEKKGVIIKLAEFNDQLVQGIADIFNETPVRQGRPFWHYGKSFEIIKKEMEDRLDKSDFIGAYFQGELVGFIKLLYTDRYAMTVEILSKIKHRDKSPTNALMAKAVELSNDKKIPYIIYSKWVDGPLGDFKKHNGFIRIELPRYYVPLNFKGEMAIKLGVHHGMKGLLPKKLRNRLIAIRSKWYGKKFNLESKVN